MPELEFTATGVTIDGVPQNAVRPRGWLRLIDLEGDVAMVRATDVLSISSDARGTAMRIRDGGRDALRVLLRTPLDEVAAAIAEAEGECHAR